MRLVRPVRVKTMPMTRDPKMNHTDGSMKSVNAVRAGRIRNRAWTVPIATAVTPMGTTSETHQVRASRKRPSEALPSRESAKCLPAGSTASGHAGER